MTALEVLDAELFGEQFVDCFYVVADGGDGKPWAVEWLGGVAWGGGAAVAE